MAANEENTSQNKMDVSTSKQLIKLNLTKDIFLGEKEYLVSEVFFTANIIKLKVLKEKGKGNSVNILTIPYKELDAFRYYITNSRKKPDFSLFVLQPKFHSYVKMMKWSNQTMNTNVPKNFIMIPLSVTKQQINCILSWGEACIDYETKLFSTITDSMAKAFLSKPNQNNIKIPSDNSNFTLNMKSFLGSGEYSDFNIVIGKIKMPVHKLILSARSPIFKTMFSHKDTVEARTNEVNITDVSIDVMKNFLSFLYTGLKPQDDQISLDLLVAADKYQVDDLKLYCEDHLSNSLTIENVVNVFLKADLHNAAKLKVKCLEIIASNFSQISLTEEWELMVKSGGDKMVEVCRALRNIQA